MNASVPQEITVPMTGVTAIAAGYSHTVALKNDGTVVAWGWNGQGQATVPAGLSGVTAIAAGFYHTVALKNDARSWLGETCMARPRFRTV